jgi:hypothetical protein
MFAAFETRALSVILLHFERPKHRMRSMSRAFAQILCKSYFFQLLENLRRILFDYGQKRTGRANAAFKAAC